MRVRLTVAILGAAAWAAPQLPTEEEQGRVLEQVREVALHYAKSLPDFICTQVVRRYIDSSGKDAWREIDTLTVKLTYFEQTEEYNLMLINNRPADRDYLSMGGALSQGEFGTTLRAVFEPKSQAEFRWKNWTNLRKRRAEVYTYRIERAKSQYIVRFGADEKHWLEAKVGYHGEVFVDRETNMVLRLTSAAEMPAGFPIQESHSTLDYDFTDVGGRQYLVPLRAQVQMRSQKLHTRNDVEFQSYRKFVSDATISFETPGEKPKK